MIEFLEAARSAIPSSRLLWAKLEKTRVIRLVRARLASCHIVVIDGLAHTLAVCEVACAHPCADRCVNEVIRRGPIVMLVPVPCLTLQHLTLVLCRKAFATCFFPLIAKPPIIGVKLLDQVPVTETMLMD